MKKVLIIKPEKNGIFKYIEKEGITIEGVQDPIPCQTDVWIKFEARLPSG